MSNETREMEQLSGEIERLAATLPVELADGLATTMMRAAAVGAGDWSYVRGKVFAAVPQAELRERVGAMLNTWRTRAPSISAQSVALALRAAARAAERERCRQTVELVWTGPDSQVVPLRRTDQALLDVVDSARERLIVVSFAVYRAENIRQALLRAADRGVAIDICLESRDAGEGKIAWDILTALGQSVASRSRLYVWPVDQRPLSPEGKYGSLHAKLAVADHRTLFVSSANLTDYAMTLNMEMGLLLTGGDLPARVAQHFQRLIELGILARTDIEG